MGTTPNRKRTQPTGQHSDAPNGRRLVVSAERREPVDLERFVAALVTLAMRRVEERAADEKGGRDG
jgi:hypothetical protein